MRLSGAPVAYGLWIFLLSGLALVAWALAQLQRRGALVRYLGGNWHYGLIGGFGTIASYSLALWAMTLAPVAVIAALRETSILFATAISGLILKERLSTVRIAAACVIALGAVTLRLP
ncbi:DMT family transporter [Pseudomonas stutzeri]|nr:DMT family transporter [Stutzerimonas stutzeri]